MKIARAFEAWQAAPSDNPRVSCLDWAKENARVELGDAVPAAERERAIDLAAEKLERPIDAVLAGAGDAPELRASDQDRARAERQRLDHVDAAPEAAVDHDRGLTAGRLDHPGKRADRSDGAVELAAAMIGDDDSIDAALDRLSRFVRMQEALEDERPAPQAAQPIDVMPADVRIELLDHERAEGGHRGARGVIGESRLRRLTHPHDPPRPAQEVGDGARAPAQGEGHSVAGVAVASGDHLVVDGEDKRLVSGGRRARGEFL